MLVYFAVILTVLLGFCGLAIDTARMELRTNQLQAAADAGALAAAGELQHASTSSNWQTAADNDIAVIETADGIPSTAPSTLTVGATTGPYSGDASTIQVTITQNFPTFFLGLVTKANASIKLSVTAVAQIPPCMFFLGPAITNTTADYWIASAANQSPSALSCPHYFKDGLVIDGFARISANQVRSASPSSYSSIPGSTWWPAVYNVPAIADPLGYISTPLVGVCLNATPVSYLNQAAATTIALTPGVYCGKTNASPTYIPGPGTSCGQTAVRITPAIDIEGKWASCPTQGGNNGNNCTTRPTVTMAPGLYVFIGGVNFTCANVTGSGVTMYFTRNLLVGYGIMHIISTQWNVSAPDDASTGGIAGIALMNDPAWVGGNQDFQLVYSSWYGDGIVYLRGTGLNGYALNMGSPNYLNIVAANMYTYDATVVPAVNYSNLPAGNPLHTVVTLVQ